MSNSFLPTANPGSLFIVWTISLPCTDRTVDCREMLFHDMLFWQKNRTAKIKEAIIA